MVRVRSKVRMLLLLMMGVVGNEIGMLHFGHLGYLRHWGSLMYLRHLRYLRILILVRNRLFGKVEFLK